MEDIRNRLIKIIESSIERNPEFNQRSSPPGEEFYFKTARSFVFPTKYIAYDLDQFLECLKNVSIYSIYFHVFEARLRGGISDFSNWLSNSLNEKELAKEFNRLDPYSQTLENLRSLLISIVEIKIKENPNA